MKTPIPRVAILVAVVVGVLAVGPFGGIAATPQSPAYNLPSKGGVITGQTYSCGLMGGLLWQNNSFPFQKYAATSQILALPAVSSWLSSHGYTLSELRPYLSMYPACGNPYDFAQGIVGFHDNGTVYNVYNYIVMNSPNGLVIGTWVTSGSPQTVGQIYTYNTTGPGIVLG